MTKLYIDEILWETNWYIEQIYVILFLTTDLSQFYFWLFSYDAIEFGNK